MWLTTETGGVADISLIASDECVEIVPEHLCADSCKAVGHFLGRKTVWCGHGMHFLCRCSYDFRWDEEKQDIPSSGGEYRYIWYLAFGILNLKSCL